MNKVVFYSVVIGLTALAAGCGGSSDGGTNAGGTGGTTVPDAAVTDAGAGTDATSSSDDTTVGPSSDAVGADVAAAEDTAQGECNPPCVGLTECVNGQCVKAHVCEAGQWYCNGLTAKKQCNVDGTDFLATEDCPGDQYCSSGMCGLKCSSDPKFGAYVGCSFWAVDLPTWDDPTMPEAKDLCEKVRQAMGGIAVITAYSGSTRNSVIEC